MSAESDTASIDISERVVSRDGRDQQVRIGQGENGAPIVEKIASASRSLEYLGHEFHILTILRDTGITPRPQKFVKGEGKAGEGILVMEYLAGASLEDRLKSNQTLSSGVFPQIAEAALDGIDAVHSKGVIVGDINMGTFIVGDEGQGLHVLDFELAQELGKDFDPNLDQLSERYESIDIGVGLAATNPEFILDTDMAKASERFQTTETILKYFFGDSSDTSINQFTTFDLSRLIPEDKDIFEQRKKMLMSYIENYVQDWRSMSPDSEKEKLRQEMLLRGSMDITLPYVLRANDIVISPNLLERLKKALSPIMSERI